MPEEDHATGADRQFKGWLKRRVAVSVDFGPDYSIVAVNDAGYDLMLHGRKGAQMLPQGNADCKRCGGFTTFWGLVAGYTRHRNSLFLRNQ